MRYLARQPPARLAVDLGALNGGQHGRVRVKVDASRVQQRRRIFERAAEGDALGALRQEADCGSLASFRINVGVLDGPGQAVGVEDRQRRGDRLKGWIGAGGIPEARVAGEGPAVPAEGLDRLELLRGQSQRLAPISVKVVGRGAPGRYGPGQGAQVHLDLIRADHVNQAPRLRTGRMSRAHKSAFGGARGAARENLVKTQLQLIALQDRNRERDVRGAHQIGEDVVVVYLAVEA